MTDGIDLYKIIGDEKTFTCHVHSFSDYIDIFGKHIMMTEPDELYATIRSIKVHDFK
jgi:hypothetical protein